ncbi:MAG: AI-2E family transporter [Chloroflexi bacterium]|nr:AI-2E family transporter [Chloroflexota bacterium]
MKQTTESPDLVRLIKRIVELWVTYIKGQLLMAVIIGAITWVVGSAIGLPGAFWLGLLAGILTTIPSLGPLLAAIPAAVVGLIEGSTVINVENWAFALIVAGVFVLIQQLSSLLIEPYIVGKRLDLPPLIVFIAVVVGAVVANVVGAYLAVPLLVTLREIARYLSAKARGEPPFPDTEPPDVEQPPQMPRA